MTTSLHQFGFFDVFDTRALSDADWELSDFDPKLTGDEFAPDADVMSHAQLSIAQEGKLQLDFYDKLDNPQLKIDTIQLGWTDIELVTWLDKNLPFIYADQPQKVAWLNQAIQYLLHERGFTVEELAYHIPPRFSSTSEKRYSANSAQDAAMDVPLRLERKWLESHLSILHHYELRWTKEQDHEPEVIQDFTPVSC